MRMKCIGAQNIPRSAPTGHPNFVLAQCRRAAAQGEHRNYVKQPEACTTPGKSMQLCLF